MNDNLRRSILRVLAVVMIMVSNAFADTFEFLTYTPPPVGWTSSAADNGSVYRRASGIGLIYFYASSAATGPAADEFSKMWRLRVEGTLPGRAPQPQIQSEGDHAIAVGSRRIDAQGTITTVALVCIVARGRAIGVLTMAAGDDALREVTTFLDSLTITPGTSAAATPGDAGEIEVDFDVPAGYVSRREGRLVLLTPATVDDRTPCAYGISPSRPSSGSLETDARAAAFVDVVPGWQLKDDRYNAMRGTAAVGWPYFWFRTDVQRLVGGSYEYATVMTMAFPGGSGRTNIVWGLGSPSRCLLDDLSFARLFHSLRPRGWTSDGGKALTRDLQGTWRNSQSVGVAQYKFMANGRYEFGIGTVTRLGLLERTSSSTHNGRYELRGSELVITPDARGRGVSKYRVRLYDEFVLGRWTRAMSLLDENAKPAADFQYMQVDDGR